MIQITSFPTLVTPFLWFLRARFPLSPLFLLFYIEEVEVLC